MQEVISKLDYACNITFIDDGSNDNTLENIRRQSLLYNNIFFISLSRNFGHQNALKAGLNFSKSDCVITIDGDMQHPPSLIPELLKKWEEGYEIVYTIRNDSNKEISKLGSFGTSFSLPRSYFINPNEFEIIKAIEMRTDWTNKDFEHIKNFLSNE